jgi:hypothetical protein
MTQKPPDPVTDELRRLLAEYDCERQHDQIVGSLEVWLHERRARREAAASHLIQRLHSLSMDTYGWDGTAPVILSARELLIVTTLALRAVDQARPAPRRGEP